MKRIRNPAVKLFVACSLTLAFAAAAGAAEPDAANPANPAQDPMAFTRGARGWADNCSRCHNIRDPRELRDDQWRAVMAHMRLRAGLTGQDTRDILKFLQESNGNTAMTTVLPVVSPVASVAPDAVGAATPEALYNQTCVACHGANGKGALPGVPDLTSDQGPLARKSDEHLVRSILDGMQTPGSAMAMPAKGGNPALSDEDAARLVRFLHERFRGK